MSEKLISKIANDFLEMDRQIIFVENPDDFFLRDDVKSELANLNILVVDESKIIQRIFFELRHTTYSEKTLVFLAEENSEYLEDMLKEGLPIERKLDHYLYGFHLESIIELKLPILDKLLQQKRVKSLSKEETLREINVLSKSNVPTYSPNLDEIDAMVQSKIEGDKKDWHSVIKIISGDLRRSIGTKYQEEIFSWINKINAQFQEELGLNYKSLISSNPIKKPAIVSKVLDHLVQFPRNQKIALLVIDGLSYWQYQMIVDHMPEEFRKQEEITYSWVPSVTELSRQAIFKGSAPDYDYVQNPRNEEKLWNSYWMNKGFQDFEIGYQHTVTGLENSNILRLAVILKELDDKMHDSEDYIDLLDLTKNWIKRSKLIDIIKNLVDKDFTVYLTTDHGSIQARGWRNLKGKEKLGTHNSKSQRHLNYSEDWIADDFFSTNPELENYVSRDENTIYFKNDYSFSNKNSLITHGGSHMLEVLIPFVKITKS